MTESKQDQETKAGEPVALHKFDCWSNNEGDSWFESPSDAELIYEQIGNEPKVGDEFYVLAGWCSVEAKYRISEINDDDIEVECISHPTESVGARDTPDTEALRKRVNELESKVAEYDRRIVAIGGIAINSIPRNAYDGMVATQAAMLVRLQEAVKAAYFEAWYTLAARHGIPMNGDDETDFAESEAAKTLTTGT